MAGSPSRVAAAALASLCLFGCVERSIEVRSDPPGARVYLDREFKGLTPLSIPFHHYGTREVAVEKEGYVPQARLRTLWPPWFGIFPLDLLFDVLLPLPLADRRDFEFRLEGREGPAADAFEKDREELEARAQAAREALRGPGGD
jgi:hypothetical protein